jgi:hypothetical protein
LKQGREIVPGFARDVVVFGLTGGSSPMFANQGSVSDA